jgi:proliferating cell nuclear antigen
MAPADAPSFELRDGDNYVVRPFFEAIYQTVDECKLRLDSDGLSVKAVDPANVFMIDAFLPAEAFDQYTVESGVVGFPLQALMPAIKGTNKSEPLDLVGDPSWGPDGEGVIIVAGGDDETDDLQRVERDDDDDDGGVPWEDPESETLAASFYIDPDSVRREPDLPDLDLPASVDVNMYEFKKGVTACKKTVSDHITLGADRDGFYTHGEGDVKDFHGTPSHEFATDHVATEEHASLFSIDYMSQIAGAFDRPKNRTFNVRFGTEYPCEIEFEVGRDDTDEDGDPLYPTADVLFILAPRIQSDDGSGGRMYGSDWTRIEQRDAVMSAERAQFDEFLKPVAALTNEALWYLRGDEMQVRSREPSNVGMIRSTYPGSGLDEYVVSGTDLLSGDAVGVNVNGLVDITKYALKRDDVEMVADMSTRMVGIVTPWYQIATGMINPDSIRDPGTVPDVEPPHTAEVDMDEWYDVLRQATDEADDVVIGAVQGRVYATWTYTVDKSTYRRLKFLESATVDGSDRVKLSAGLGTKNDILRRVVMDADNRKQGRLEFKFGRDSHAELEFTNAGGGTVEYWQGAKTNWDVEDVIDSELSDLVDAGLDEQTVMEELFGFSSVGGMGFLEFTDTLERSMPGTAVSLRFDVDDLADDEFEVSISQLGYGKKEDSEGNEVEFDSTPSSVVGEIDDPAEAVRQAILNYHIAVGNVDELAPGPIQDARAEFPYDVPSIEEGQDRRLEPFTGTVPVNVSWWDMTERLKFDLQTNDSDVPSMPSAIRERIEDEVEERATEKYIIDELRLVAQMQDEGSVSRTGKLGEVTLEEAEVVGLDTSHADSVLDKWSDTRIESALEDVWTYKQGWVLTESDAVGGRVRWTFAWPKNARTADETVVRMDMLMEYDRDSEQWELRGETIGDGGFGIEVIEETDLGTYGFGEDALEEAKSRQEKYPDIDREADLDTRVMAFLDTTTAVDTVEAKAGIFQTWTESEYADLVDYAVGPEFDNLRYKGVPESFLAWASLKHAGDYKDALEAVEEGKYDDASWDEYMEQYRQAGLTAESPDVEDDDPDMDTEAGELIVGGGRVSLPEPWDGWDELVLVNQNEDDLPDDDEADHAVYISEDRKYGLIIHGTRVSNKWGIRAIEYEVPLIRGPVSPKTLLHGSGQDRDRSEKHPVTHGNTAGAGAKRIFRDNAPTVPETRNLFAEVETRPITVEKYTTGPGYTVDGVTMEVNEEIAEEIEDELGPAAQFDIGTQVGTVRTRKSELASLRDVEAIEYSAPDVEADEDDETEEYGDSPEGRNERVREMANGYYDELESAVRSSNVPLQLTDVTGIGSTSRERFEKIGVRNMVDLALAYKSNEFGGDVDRVIDQIPPTHRGGVRDVVQVARGEVVLSTLSALESDEESPEDVEEAGEEPAVSEPDEADEDDERSEYVDVDAETLDPDEFYDRTRLIVRVTEGEFEAVVLDTEDAEIADALRDEAEKKTRSTFRAYYFEEGDIVAEFGVDTYGREGPQITSERYVLGMLLLAERSTNDGGDLTVTPEDGWVAVRPWELRQLAEGDLVGLFGGMPVVDFANGGPIVGWQNDRKYWIRVQGREQLAWVYRWEGSIQASIDEGDVNKLYAFPIHREDPDDPFLGIVADSDDGPWPGMPYTRSMLPEHDEFEPYIRSGDELQDLVGTNVLVRSNAGWVYNAEVGRGAETDAGVILSTSRWAESHEWYIPASSRSEDNEDDILATGIPENYVVTAWNDGPGYRTDEGEVVPVDAYERGETTTTTPGEMTLERPEDEPIDEERTAEEAESLEYPAPLEGMPAGLAPLLGYRPGWSQFQTPDEDTNWVRIGPSELATASEFAARAHGDRQSALGVGEYIKLPGVGAPFKVENVREEGFDLVSTESGDDNFYELLLPDEDGYLEFTVVRDGDEVGTVDDIYITAAAFARAWYNKIRDLRLILELWPGDVVNWNSIGDSATVTERDGTVSPDRLVFEQADGFEIEVSDPWSLETDRGNPIRDLEVIEWTPRDDRGLPVGVRPEKADEEPEPDEEPADDEDLSHDEKRKAAAEAVVVSYNRPLTGEAEAALDEYGWITAEHPNEPANYTRVWVEERPPKEVLEEHELTIDEDPIETWWTDSGSLVRIYTDVVTEDGTELGITPDTALDETRDQDQFHPVSTLPEPVDLSELTDEALFSAKQVFEEASEAGVSDSALMLALTTVASEIPHTRQDALEDQRVMDILTERGVNTTNLHAYLHPGERLAVIRSVDEVREMIEETPEEHAGLMYDIDALEEGDRIEVVPLNEDADRGPWTLTLTTEGTITSKGTYLTEWDEILTVKFPHRLASDDDGGDYALVGMGGGLNLIPFVGTAQQAERQRLYSVGYRYADDESPEVEVEEETEDDVERERVSDTAFKTGASVVHPEYGLGVVTGVSVDGVAVDFGDTSEPRSIRPGDLEATEEAVDRQRVDAELLSSIGNWLYREDRSDNMSHVWRLDHSHPVFPRSDVIDVRVYGIPGVLGWGAAVIGVDEDGWDKKEYVLYSQDDDLSEEEAVERARDMMDHSIGGTQPNVPPEYPETRTLAGLGSDEEPPEEPTDEEPTDDDFPIRVSVVYAPSDGKPDVELVTSEQHRLDRDSTERILNSLRIVAEAETFEEGEEMALFRFDSPDSYEVERYESVLDTRPIEEAVEYLEEKFGRSFGGGDEQQTALTDAELEERYGDQLRAKAPPADVDPLEVWEGPDGQLIELYPGAAYVNGTYAHARPGRIAGVAREDDRYRLIRMNRGPFLQTPFASRVGEWRLLPMETWDNPQHPEWVGQAKKRRRQRGDNMGVLGRLVVARAGQYDDDPGYEYAVFVRTPQHGDAATVKIYESDDPQEALEAAIRYMRERSPADDPQPVTVPDREDAAAADETETDDMPDTDPDTPGPVYGIEWVDLPRALEEVMPGTTVDVRHNDTQVVLNPSINEDAPVEFRAQVRPVDGRHSVLSSLVTDLVNEYDRVVEADSLDVEELMQRRESSPIPTVEFDPDREDKATARSPKQADEEPRDDQAGGGGTETTGRDPVWQEIYDIIHNQRAGQRRMDKETRGALAAEKFEQWFDKNHPGVIEDSTIRLLFTPEGKLRSIQADVYITPEAGENLAGHSMFTHTRDDDSVRVRLTVRAGSEEPSQLAENLVDLVSLLDRSNDEHTELQNKLDQIAQLTFRQIQRRSVDFDNVFLTADEVRPFVRLSPGLYQKAILPRMEDVDASVYAAQRAHEIHTGANVRREIEREASPKAAIDSRSGLVDVALEEMDSGDWDPGMFVRRYFDASNRDVPEDLYRGQAPARRGSRGEESDTEPDPSSGEPEQEPAPTETPSASEEAASAPAVSSPLTPDTPTGPTDRERRVQTLVAESEGVIELSSELLGRAEEVGLRETAPAVEASAGAESVRENLDALEQYDADAWSEDQLETIEQVIESTDDTLDTLRDRVEAAETEATDETMPEPTPETTPDSTQETESDPYEDADLETIIAEEGPVRVEVIALDRGSWNVPAIRLPEYPDKTMREGYGVADTVAIRVHRELDVDDYDHGTVLGTAVVDESTVFSLELTPTAADSGDLGDDPAVEPSGFGDVEESAPTGGPTSGGVPQGAQSVSVQSIESADLSGSSWDVGELDIERLEIDLVDIDDLSVGDADPGTVRSIRDDIERNMGGNS